MGAAGGGGGAAHVEEQLLGEVPLAAALQGADQAAARDHVRVHAPRLHVPEHLRGDMGEVLTRGSCATIQDLEYRILHVTMFASTLPEDMHTWVDLEHEGCAR